MDPRSSNPCHSRVNCIFNFYMVSNCFENLMLSFQETKDMIEFELDRETVSNLGNSLINEEKL